MTNESCLNFIVVTLILISVSGVNQLKNPIKIHQHYKYFFKKHKAFGVLSRIYSVITVSSKNPAGSRV